jgi:hypothetical protein
VSGRNPTELKIKKVATLVRANRSQTIDKIKQQQQHGLAMILATKLFLMT